jgi:NADH-quinone oxidoreductase subunit M
VNQTAILWLEIAILLPLVGGLLLTQLSDAFYARRWAIVISGLSFLGTIFAWGFGEQAALSESSFSIGRLVAGRLLVTVDSLNAPLLPAVAMLQFLTALTTLRTKIRRFSFGWALVGESLALLTLAARDEWLVIAAASLATIPPFLELRQRGRPTGAYAAHMLAFVVMLVWGWAAVQAEGGGRVHTLWAVVPLLGAILIRTGIAPWHCWMTDLFENATFGTALLFATPITGACLAARLVIPVAPDWVLRGMGLLSLMTAVYASGLALVQGEARRFYCYLFLSHSAMVLVGLEMKTAIGLSGALCVWLSVIVSLGGLGLTLRAVEARQGRIVLGDHLGLYDHMRPLAACFMVTGLGTVGFPGTLGFVGTELLVDGAVTMYPYIGVALVVAAAMNGIAVVRAYFLLFAGPPCRSTVSLAPGPRERIMVVAVMALVILPGLLPGTTTASRYRAAIDLMQRSAREQGMPLPLIEAPGHPGHPAADTHPAH